ncbi:NAD(+)--dinitrogen-reductase ADP-D-ribosyltransferase [Derxia gummosa]|uniref:NAD(+)--dinitrogen-reductase ADP-D-ribosyltransferase n=1 Tax=Derxia gummosa DSM 723 TaxID=1121388 RepID=A0A8B6X1M8_9BURK|nr:NAD(+)--dinitrogen-reductase ADP-D-ribosyltransferase [Derxia gummosa]
MASASADPDHPRAWATTNVVGVSSEWIASADFNDKPSRLRIAGARSSARGLFDQLDRVGNLREAGNVFRRYMEAAFGLKPDHEARQRSERLRWKSSYLKLLEGWGFDSNGPQGAVLKGWVESRFGLVPTWHHGALGRFPSDAWVRYIEEKMTSRFHGNCINMQLDLLFEYCQWAIRRFHLPPRANGVHTVKVWRCVNGLGEHRFVEGGLRERRGTVHLNNLVSFSLSREHAEAFGDWMLETEVAVEKLVFVPGLLGQSLLAGEGEVIALGGEYRVKASYA